MFSKKRLYFFIECLILNELSIYQSIYLFIYLSTDLSLCLSLYILYIYIYYIRCICTGYVPRKEILNSLANSSFFPPVQQFNLSFFFQTISNSPLPNENINYKTYI